MRSVAGATLSDRAADEADPETIAAASALRRRVGSPGILLAGVDRLDYTKGFGWTESFVVD